MYAPYAPLIAVPYIQLYCCLAPTVPASSCDLFSSRCRSLFLHRIHWKDDLVYSLKSHFVTTYTRVLWVRKRYGVIDLRSVMDYLLRHQLMLHLPKTRFSLVKLFYLRRKCMTLVIRRDNESFDSLLRRFRKKVNQDRLKTEVRKRRYFITKGEQARIAKRKGIQRARRKKHKNYRD